MVRLQAFLAALGIGSRRKCESYIDEGRVFVNGEKACLGQKVDSNDQIKIDGKDVSYLAQIKQKTKILIYNKPLGEICSRFDQKHKRTVFDNLPKLPIGKWISVGRLDLNTSGLLLFTNNGILANKLMHPRYSFEREYLVRIQGSLTPIQIDNLHNGIEIDNIYYKAHKITRYRKEDASNNWYKIVLETGKNKEVRKLIESQGLRVNRLIRVRYGFLTLPKHLRTGMWQELSEKDIAQVITITDSL